MELLRHLKTKPKPNRSTDHSQIARVNLSHTRPHYEVHKQEDGRKLCANQRHALVGNQTFDIVDGTKGNAVHKRVTDIEQPIGRNWLYKR